MLDTFHCAMCDLDLPTPMKADYEPGETHLPRFCQTCWQKLEGADPAQEDL